MIETYAHSTEHLKILIYACIAKINKNTFIEKLKNLVKSVGNSYSNSIKNIFQDFPLNSSLINIPAYSNFIV